MIDSLNTILQRKNREVHAGFYDIIHGFFR